jgi:chaperonin GroEL
MKLVDFSPRLKLKKGLDTVADSVKLTIGPKGRNVVIDRGYDPLISNDGGTIAQEIQLKDKVENMGAQIIKGVIRKTSESVGGGRTASAILTQAIVTEGLKQVENGMNMTLFKKGMTQAVQDITDNLKANAKEVSTPEEIKQIATISTESEDLGEVISNVIDKVGKDCVVTVEESQTFGITSEVVDGLKFDRGYVSPYMITSPERMEAELVDVPVMVTDKKISIFKDIFGVIKNLVDNGTNSLVVICEDFDGDALNQAIRMKVMGQFNLVAIKAPGYQDKSDWLEDIALTVGTQVISDKTGVKLDTNLGKAKKVISTKDSTVIVSGDNILKEVAHLENLRTQLENTESKWDKDRLERRLATLTGSVAVIKVGAATESELKYLKQKIEDGVNEAKRALEEGIVIGGDCAFIHASNGLHENAISENMEFDRGYETILRAVEAPLRQIITNSNGSPDVVINELKNAKNTAGYNALTNEIEKDMFKAGIIDALKVSRTVLENALSGASMFLTIECAISDEPEPTKERVEY